MNKIYRPEEEVCFECGKYFNKDKMIACNHPMMMKKVLLCKSCFTKKFDMDFRPMR